MVAIERAHGQRWGNTEELLAQQTELLHAILRVLITSNTPKDKRRSWPEFRVPRPSDQAKAGSKRVTWGQLAAQMIGR